MINSTFKSYTVSLFLNSSEAAQHLEREQQIVAWNWMGWSLLQVLSIATSNETDNHIPPLQLYIATFCICLSLPDGTQSRACKKP